MLSWPFPKANSQFSYKAQAFDTRSKTTEALIGQRHRYDGQITLATVSWQLTDDEAWDFEGWHHWQLQCGANWFTIAVPIDGEQTEVVARFNDGIYTLAYSEGKVWILSAKLDIDVLPNVIATLDEMEAGFDLISGLLTDDGSYLFNDEGKPRYYTVDRLSKNP